MLKDKMIMLISEYKTKKIKEKSNKMMKEKIKDIKKEIEELEQDILNPNTKEIEKRLKKAILEQRKGALKVFENLNNI